MPVPSPIKKKRGTKTYTILSKYGGGYINNLTFRKHLCEDCLKVLREYEAKKQKKFRSLKVKGRQPQVSGKIKIKKL